MIIIAGYARLLSILKYRILLGSPDDRSQVTMIFDPEGVWIEDEDSKLELSWSAIDGISAIRGGFAVHAGIVAFGVPNDALPQNVTLEKLRDQAEAWSKSQVFA